MSVGFDVALCFMKAGRRMTREAWGKKRVYVTFVPGSLMKVTRRSVTRWRATSDDLLADDWFVSPETR